jgi:monoamine oxidase
MEKIVIIGGGLAGLTAAYRLKKHGLDPLILEAGDRLGGRIYTKSAHGRKFELGATWVFEDLRLRRLIEELGLTIYPQFLEGEALIKYQPSMDIQRSPTGSLMDGAVYHKISGGTGAIIDALASQFPRERILLNKKVTTIESQDDYIALTTEDGFIQKASTVIITVPPKVIAHQIKILPQIDNHQIMRSTHTWMGDSAKFTILFDRDYWREKNLSGFVFSNYGLIREVQDHTTEESYGLLGFMYPAGELAVNYEKRRSTVIRELKELFDIKEQRVLGYDDFLWREYYSDEDHINYNYGLMPHQNNGHAFFRDSHFNGHLFFAGAETSPANPGYMEGAVRSADRAVKMLLKQMEEKD